MTAAADLARAIPMTAKLSALGLRKVNVRKRPETGKLMIDLWHQGIRCREQTELYDTPENRERLERLAEVIEREMREGVFDFAAVFPHSPRAAMFGASRVAAEPTPAEEPRPRQPKGQASRQERQNLPWSAEDLAGLAATNGKASALRVLAIRLGRTVRSVSERYKRLAPEVGGSAPQRTNARGRVVPWTAAELDWLRRNYAGASVETLAANLPNRSLTAIRVRASEMGLALPRPAAARLAIARAGRGAAKAAPAPEPATTQHAADWDEEEDSVLRGRYANEGAAALARDHAFQGRRSERQIRKRAKQLGLTYLPGGKAPHGNQTRWLEHEDGVLRAHFTERGPTWIRNNRLPGRSPVAITLRAALLGLEYKRAVAPHAPGKPWTAEEFDVIKAYCAEGASAVFPVLAGRTRRAVASKIAALRAGRGTSRVLRPWVAQDDAYLLGNYAARGAERCAKDLKRTLAAVYRRAQVLGLVGERKRRTPRIRTGA